jgi:hypothetical protein
MTDAVTVRVSRAANDSDFASPAYAPTLGPALSANGQAAIFDTLAPGRRRRYEQTPRRLRAGTATPITASPELAAGHGALGEATRSANAGAWPWRHHGDHAVMYPPSRGMSPVPSTWIKCRSSERVTASMVPSGDHTGSSHYWRYPLEHEAALRRRTLGRYVRPIARSSRHQVRCLA